MNFPIPPIFVFLFFSFAIYFLHHRKVLPKFFKIVARLIQQTTSMPIVSRKKVFGALLRIIRLNWYSVLMMILLWYVLFEIPVGSDTIETYLENLPSFSWDGKLYSLFTLFSTIFIFSLSIWLIPFFLYSDDRIEETRARTESFYAGTKLLALLAMVPFYILSNVFLKHAFPERLAEYWKLIIINVLIIAFFSSLEYLYSFIKGKDRIKKLVEALTIRMQKRYGGILVSVLIIQLVISLVFATILLAEKINIALTVSIYLFISSACVFRILFYTDESNFDVAGLSKWFDDLFSPENRRESFYIFWILAGIVAAWNVYYFFIPSLMETNTLYILFAIFSLVVVYSDYFRNIYQSGPISSKVVAVIAFVVFFSSPALSPEEQFRVPMLALKTKNTGLMSVNANLETALRARLDTIYAHGKEGPVYLICGMGGGSRAGFITSSILSKIDTIFPGVWNRTICYSTISGSSPGVYHYLRVRDFTFDLQQDMLRKMYDRNYNSGGVFGLFLGDPLEALLGGMLAPAKGAMLDTVAPTGYFDRNLRIRMEYQMAMNKAIYDTKTTDKKEDGLKRYFRNSFPSQKGPVDMFRAYFHECYASVPLHLINSFEVNSGRRTILSPFPVGDTLMFANTILPLQDSRFDCQVKQKDVTYRDASNLSELFPFFSAVSTIGESSFQFADGGNFENYGLATAMDVAKYLIDKKMVSKKNIRIILIKNSAQNPTTPTSKGQLLAPVIGVLNAPFTGHANHFLVECAKTYKKNFRIILFDSGKKNFEVPLTRALTKGHIDKMAKAVELSSKELKTRLLSPGDAVFVDHK